MRRKHHNFAEDVISRITKAMIEYYAGDARRINHFLKVHSIAKTIGELEGLDLSTQMILETAALTHDIGIKNSEKKYDSSAGKHQQIEGPPEAKALLSQLCIHPEVIERVCWLIAHHHTYTDIQDLDYQILVEADFLVNIYEEDFSQQAIKHIRTNVFKTVQGIYFLDTIYRSTLEFQKD